MFCFIYIGIIIYFISIRYLNVIWLIIWKSFSYLRKVYILYFFNYLKTLKPNLTHSLIMLYVTMVFWNWIIYVLIFYCPSVDWILFYLLALIMYFISHLLTPDIIIICMCEIYVAILFFARLLILKIIKMI